MECTDNKLGTNSLLQELYFTLQRRGYDVTISDSELVMARNSVYIPELNEAPNLVLDIKIVDKGTTTIEESLPITISVYDGNIFLFMDDNPEYREVINSELKGNEDRHSPLAKSLIPLVFSTLNARGVAFNKWNMTEKTTILNEEEKILCIREILLQANIQSKDIDDELLRISLTISQFKSAIFQLGINPSETDYSSTKKDILNFLLRTS